MDVVYWLFIGGAFAALGVWLIKRATWVRQLRREKVGQYDLLDLWLEVLVNGKP